MNTNSITRLTKAALTGFFGLYALFVAFGNVTDYQSNYQFVHHVLSMDTTFEGNSLMYRAITSSTLHHVGYIFIIVLEWAIAILCLLGAFKMIKHRNDDAIAFHEAKKWGIVGLLLGISVWFLGFQVVGGEWFAMWQSSDWNGLDSAFRLTTYIGTTLITLLLKDE
ncbi:MAG TPA: DUF2165 domain-containing protein [Candidatus Avamphibacillus intestinigallinarum]|nr:DUF2165 domain-containing protein [Candidatus Avamphibacillus intestinigallinarum]